MSQSGRGTPGPIFVSDLNLHFGPHQDTPAFLHPGSREYEFSLDTGTPDTLPEGHSSTLMGRNQNHKPGTFTPRDLENKSFPPELQLNKANNADTEAPFLDLHLSISNGFVSSKIYDKRDDFDFDIVNFPFLDGDVPLSTSYGVYISQLIRFARVLVM